VTREAERVAEPETSQDKQKGMTHELERRVEGATMGLVLKEYQPKDFSLPAVVDGHER